MFGSISEKCRLHLVQFISQLMKDHWTIAEVKDELQFLKWERLEGEYQDVLDDVLSSLLINEANRRFYNTKAKLIQKYWRNAISNPNYLCCQTRLMREASEIPDNLSTVK